MISDVTVLACGMQDVKIIDRLKHQLIAECTYAAMFAMRDPKGKTVEDLFPMLFEEEDYDLPPISDAEVSDLQADIAAYNAANSKP